MARMYEMNLVIRLQDRASARMRRISGDMSAMAKHAQDQNKLMRMRSTLEKTQVQRGQMIARQIESSVRMGSKQNAVLSQQSSITSQLLRQEAALNRGRAARRGQPPIRAMNARTRKIFWDAETDGARRAFLERNKYTKAEAAALYQWLALEARRVGLEGKITEELANQNRQIEGSIALERQLNAEIARRAALESRANQAANLYRTGRTAAHAGSLAFMGGAVTLGVAGLSGAAYSKFNVQAAKAATQVGDTNIGIIESINQTRDATEELEQRLLGLAKQYPATAEEMAAAQYNVFSSMDLGATAAERMENGIRVLTEANKAAVGGQVDLATATDTLITVFNDFDSNLANIPQNMAQLFAIVRFMRGGFEELSAGMNKLAPAAKQAHYSLLDVGAAFAVITQAIPSAAQASTAESRLIDLFGRPEFIAGMEKFAAAAGKGAESISVIDKSTGQLKSISEIMGNILKIDPGLAQGGPRLANFIKQITQLGSETGEAGFQGTIFMQRALSVLITEHGKHLNILKQAREDTIEYEKSVQILSETADVKWKTAMNNLRVAFIQFGAAAMPMLLQLLEYFTKVFDYFNNMSATNRKVIASLVIIVGLLGTVGGLMASAFGGIAMVVATRRLYSIQKAIEAVAVAETAVGTNAATSATKVGLLTRALTALTLLGPIAVVITIKVYEDEINKWIRQFRIGRWAIGSGKPMPVPVQLELLNDPEKFKMLPEFVQDALRKAQEARQKKQMDAQESKVTKKKLDESIKATDDSLAAILEADKKKKESEKELAAWTKRYEKAKIAARQQAMKEQESQIESAAKNMLAKYKELEQANQAAIGGIFGGPISGGPILGAFNEVNNTLMGLGIKPIKVPLEFIMQDAQMQLQNFDLWRGSLDKLAKRVPKEMLVELRAAGIDKLPEVLSLADAGPEFLKQYVKVWKDTKSARDAATQADMKSTLTLWNSYGKDVAWQIVNGLVDSGAEAKLYEQFSKTITTTFAGQLTASMNKAVDEAIASWLEGNPKPSVTPGATPAQMTAATTATKKTQAILAEQERLAQLEWLSSSGYASPLRTLPDASKKFYPPSKAKDTSKYPPSRFGFGWASGGVIGGSGRGDTVPAMLTPGEVVLNKRQIANASRLLGTANNPHAVFKGVQYFDGGGVAEGYGTASERRANYEKYVRPGLKRKKKHTWLDAVTGGGKVQRFAKWAVGGEGGLYKMGKDFAQGFTNEGLKAQGKAIWDNITHPTMYGGQMTYPGAGRGPRALGQTAKPFTAGEQFQNYLKMARDMAKHPSQSFKSSVPASYWKTPEGFNVIREHQDIVDKKATTKTFPVGTEQTYGLYSNRGPAHARVRIGFHKDHTSVTDWRLLNDDKSEFYFMANDMLSMLEPAFRRDVPIDINSVPTGYAHILRDVINQHPHRFTEQTRNDFNLDTSKVNKSAIMQATLSRLWNEQTGTLDVSKFNRNKWYHGSTVDWKNFDLSKSNPNGLLGPGLYLSRTKGIADTYSTPLVVRDGQTPTIKTFKFEPDKVFGYDDPVPLKEFKRIWDLSPKLDRFSQMSQMRLERLYKTREVLGSEIWNALSESIHRRLASKDPVFGMSQDMMDQVTRSRISRDARTQVNQILSDAGYDAIAMDYVKGYKNDVLNVLPRGMTRLSMLSSKSAIKRNKGGYVPGSGNSDTVPAWLTPGEYVVSKPLVNKLNSQGGATSTSTVKHETNITVQAANPTAQAIVDALNPILFGLRHR